MDDGVLKDTRWGYGWAYRINGQQVLKYTENTRFWTGYFGTVAIWDVKTGSFVISASQFVPVDSADYFTSLTISNVLKLSDEIWQIVA